MKHSYNLLLFFSLVVISFFSCDKNNLNVPGKDSCTLTKIVRAPHLNLPDLSYNVVVKDNKITRLTSTRYDIKYTYNKDGFLWKKEMFLATTGELVSKIEFQTNTTGQIISLTDTVFLAEDGYISHIERNEFSYSGNNVTGCRYFDERNSYTGKDIYYWDNGNLVSYSQYDKNGLLLDSVNILYSLSSQNKITDESMKFILQDFISGSASSQTAIPAYKFFFTSKNLITNISTVYQLTEKKSVKFESNAKGLITKIYANEYPWWIFSYSCD